MFCLFVEDLEVYLQNRHDCGNLLQDLRLIVLLFADDMVVIGETPEDLQLSLNRLQDYCNTWSLEVNISKTKVVVFRNRGNKRANE